MENDPNIVILVWREDNKIIKIKDHYDVLVLKVQELEKKGIEAAMFALNQEPYIMAILAKAGAKRQLMH